MNQRATTGKALADFASNANGIRVICLGLAALDQIWRIDTLFEGGSEKIRSLEYSTAGGGMAANAAVAVARLGGVTSFWGRGGDEAAGREMRAALRARASTSRVSSCFRAVFRRCRASLSTNRASGRS